MLKIFPVAAFVVLLSIRKLRLRSFAAIAAVGIYFFVIRADVALIRAGTPTSDWLSYGLPSVAAWLLQRRVPLSLLTAYAISGMAVAVALVAGIVLQRCWLARGVSPKLSVPVRESFLTGAVLYVATYCLSSNWDYRLVFTLLTVPALNAWRRSESRHHQVVAYVGLTTLLVAMSQEPLLHLYGGRGLAANLASTLGLLRRLFMRERRPVGQEGNPTLSNSGSDVQISRRQSLLRPVPAGGAAQLRAEVSSRIR